ncbi:glycosyltransferase [Serinicoccus sp. LYQ131]|uniref:glycosyltransferase n=1 Tax=Serinicoccus sp. LYQ131 TaxID=3378797 RepID=UPI0038546EC9
MSDVAASTSAQVAADHARIAAQRSRALVATTLRTRSVHAREVLAQVAWPGHTPADLEAWAARGPGAGIPENADPVGVADHARVLAVQLGLPEEQQSARALLEQLASTEHWAAVRREHRELLAQLRVLGGDPDGALSLVEGEGIRPGVASSVRADALNPHLVPGADPHAWATAFSAALGGGRLAPVAAPVPGALPSLDDLRVSGPPEPVADGTGGGRVSVMMSCYRPGPALLTAVRSVLAQTWADLELFVVDDASGPGEDHRWDALLEQVADADPRVRVVRKAVNGGTYRARNTALRLASGDFGIVLDSDDWWHPQTLEVCLRPFRRRPGLLATRAEGVRVTPDLVLTRPGYQPRFPSAATVLFRLGPVLTRIGFYDPTRKGADTEFTRRLEAAFGPVVQDVPETTTILRGGGVTLSSEEFANGYRHPARHQYKSLYTAWHEEISTGRSAPFLDPDEPRRVPEPARWARATHPLREPVRHLDLVLAGDWRRHGGPQASMVEEILAARAAGLRVGVMHLEALRFMTTGDRPVSAQLVDLVRSGTVSWVAPDDDVDIDVLMVRYPPILQYPPRLPRTVRAGHVLVMANQGPLEPDGTDQRYVVADVTARTRELFGAPVTWVPQSPTIRRLLLEQDPGVALTTWDNPGRIDVDAWAVRSAEPPGADRTVVVGRHSRDDRIKFPTSYAELHQGYAFPDGYQVRMLGGQVTVAGLASAAGAEVPSGWQVLPTTHGDVRPFLAGLDFFLYLDNPDAHEAFGRTLLEAAASGVLTIAHPKHRETFGDVLEYAAPGEAQAVVAGYLADPEAYRERVARTTALVRERYGHQGFVEQLRPLLTRWSAEQEGARAAAAEADVEPGADDAAGVSVERLPLRSAADAERADELSVVHDAVPPEALRAWLTAYLPDPLGPAWEPGALLAAAPTGVREVVLRRDGVVEHLQPDRGHRPGPDA